MMRFLAFSVLLIAVLTACITIVEVPERIPFVDPRVKSLLADFQNDFAEFQKIPGNSPNKMYFSPNTITILIKPITLKGDKNTRIIGTCSFDAYNMPHVVLDETDWYATTDAGKKWVVYHELGHCLLGQNHRDFKVKFGNDIIKGSIMDAIRGLSYDLELYNPYYMQELFSNKQGGFHECNLLQN